MFLIRFRLKCGCAVAPRLDLLGTLFESSVHAACGAMLVLLPASLATTAIGLQEELCSSLRLQAPLRYVMCGWPPDVCAHCMPAKNVQLDIWIATGFHVVYGFNF